MLTVLGPTTIRPMKKKWMQIQWKDPIMTPKKTLLA
ncbi:hypothetical protein PC116_g31375 [Phytophthora cactorum]|nr:hypothetical protein PC116_g31375 [Phytophthora cactorum]